MSLKFITSNSNKAEEVRRILQTPLERVNLDLKEIQSLDVNMVVKDKVKRAYEAINSPVIVEDTGLFLKELNGFPGALTKWTLNSLGLKGICRLLDKNREAYAKTAVGYCEEGEIKVFDGIISGKIPTEPLGNSSFGWDPIFVPKGYSESFAQLGSEIKNKISMRRKAFLKLKEHLKER